MPGRVAAVAACALLAGCACEPERVEVPIAVEVPGPVRYAPIPAELLAECSDRPAPIAAGITSGELLATAKGWERWAACVSGQRAALRALSGPPAAPGPK